MTDLATNLARPRGRYGVDGDYRLIPAPVLLAGDPLLCLAAATLAGLWLASGRTLPGLGAAIVAVLLIAAGVSVWRFSRRGKVDARRSAIDEAVRVLRPGGHVVIADLGFTRLYATRLEQRGMADVRRRDLGWRAWWGLPFFRMHAVTATKPGPIR